MRAEDDARNSSRIAVGAGLLVVLLIAGVVLTALAWRDSRKSETSAVRTAVPASTMATYSSICGTEARDFDKPGSDFDAYPKTLPTGVRIVVHDDAGPCQLDGDVPRGYVFSPKGATLAALNYVSLMTAGGDGISDVIATLNVPGPATDAMRADVEARPLTVTDQARVKGFKVVTTSKATEVRVVVAIEFPSEPGVMVAWTLTLVWQDHDWWVVPMDIAAGWEMSQVTDLADEGFTEWGF